jgi:hypothetical protein
MRDFLSKLFEKLNDNVVYDINSIYINYILPIAKNADIYALSWSIYEIFFGILFKNILAYKIVNENTNNLVKNLLNDALYNTINGPNDLSKRLDQIINSI